MKKFILFLLKLNDHMDSTTLRSAYPNRYRDPFVLSVVPKERSRMDTNGKVRWFQKAIIVFYLIACISYLYPTKRKLDDITHDHRQKFNYSYYHNMYTNLKREYNLIPENSPLKLGLFYHLKRYEIIITFYEKYNDNNNS